MPVHPNFENRYTCAFSALLTTMPDISVPSQKSLNILTLIITIAGQRIDDRSWQGNYVTGKIRYNSKTQLPKHATTLWQPGANAIKATLHHRAYSLPIQLSSALWEHWEDVPLNRWTIAASLCYVCKWTRHGTAAQPFHYSTVPPYLSLPFSRYTAITFIRFSLLSFFSSLFLCSFSPSALSHRLHHYLIPSRHHATMAARFSVYPTLTHQSIKLPDTTR